MRVTISGVNGQRGVGWLSRLRARRGHDYFLQCTDARPDTGGLSGATPAEAVSWGKIDPGNLPACVVCYLDSTISLPLITAYALTRLAPRKRKNLYARRDEQLAAIKAQYLKKGTVEKIAHRTDVSDVKDFGTAPPKEKPRRNLAKRASGVGMGKS